MTKYAKALEALEYAIGVTGKQAVVGGEVFEYVANSTGDRGAWVQLHFSGGSLVNADYVDEAIAAEIGLPV